MSLLLSFVGCPIIVSTYDGAFLVRLWTYSTSLDVVPFQTEKQNKIVMILTAIRVTAFCQVCQVKITSLYSEVVGQTYTLFIIDLKS